MDATSVFLLAGRGVRLLGGDGERGQVVAAPLFMVTSPLPEALSARARRL